MLFVSDIADNANLVVFVRYAHQERVHEDLLFFRSLPLHTTAEALFDVVDNFLQKIILTGISVLMCTLMLLHQCQVNMRIL